ncbi:rRNA processing protein Utp6 [Cordyceps militaris CM01]|uniref:rRNA processing protein Utp6 n=1 Tax=Cordyceps militaris (strain CM01) TaxID=983644 RepID=G3J7V4_CORMM|nr:rRNA processing protein Utp6 [Cordyceps militaris CM01]EGX96368.1 rRNA processing protein Utp6 [Cordyceps militaris CM01]
MAGVAEKARFFLERSVPQLREWGEKEIFSKVHCAPPPTSSRHQPNLTSTLFLILQDEIRTIVQKRNQHEHKVLAPGNTVYEWSAYAQWEQSLETLRAKRCRRLRIRHLTSAHAGQGRVLGIYERAVGRHPGSSALWREYLAYTAGVKASKRWRRTVTAALRMLPADADLWVAAGRRAAHNGDMAAARGFFMRGCRFCTADDRLWIEYARCEMEWLAKMEDKKNKEESKGQGAAAAEPVRRGPADDDELRLEESDDEGKEEDGVVLPDLTKVQAEVIDETAARQLANPALDGAIPMAIFDIARKQGFYTPDVAERFFLVFAAFRPLSVYPRIAQHVLDALAADSPRHPAAASCLIRQPVAGISPLTAEFPRGLREALPRLAAQLAATSDHAALVQKTEAWIDECLAVDGLHEGIRTVLENARSSLTEDAE